MRCLHVIGGDHGGSQHHGLLADQRSQEVGAGLANQPSAVLGRSLTDALDEYERELITAALTQAQGNMAEAARILQTDRANLYRRMRRLGVEKSAEVEL